MLLVLALVLSGGVAEARTKARTTAAAASRNTGDGLAAGNLILRGDIQLDYNQVQGQKQLILGVRTIAEYLVNRYFAIGGFLKTQYLWQGANTGAGMVDVGPRVSVYLVPSGIVHPYIGAQFGYHRLVQPGPDGNGIIVGPEVGVAIITGHFGAFISAGYDFRWAKCSGVTLKRHAVPFSIGFGGRF